MKLLNLIKAAKISQDIMNDMESVTKKSVEKAKNAQAQAEAVDGTENSQTLTELVLEIEGVTKRIVKKSKKSKKSKKARDRAQLVEELQSTYRKAKIDGRTMIISYLPAGFPNLDMSHKIMLEMQAAGIDIIQLGVPFADSALDDRVIRAINVYAMKQRIPFDFDAVAAIVGQARGKGLTIPVLVRVHSIMVRQYGVKRIVSDCIHRKARINGIICPDATWEQVKHLSKLCRRKGLAYVPHISGEQPDSTVKKLCKLSNGLVYIASGPWVAGRKQDVDSELFKLLSQVEGIATFDGVRLLEIGKVDFRGCLEMDGLAEGLVLGFPILRATIYAIRDAVVDYHLSFGPTNLRITDEELKKFAKSPFAPFRLKKLREFIEEFMKTQRRTASKRNPFQLAGLYVLLQSPDVIGTISIWASG
ncbi:uncharacterized protein N7498_008736 [Penicillium cinerascens]|uniref:tryptophan synthase n=1 Tax=Penicillium cinerascens TaxID=70096 RepID=A0A9W9JE08_9EURO|nr:uncharacterized protein N7498_008736 [Penicillium cinerascens]KAJ5195298.1 hypothetical protein N7498_008736 [Penicillium cinerascens]